MKIALIGDHPDGLDIVRAMTSGKRHELHAYAGPAFGAEALAREGLSPRRAGDLEDVLADPEVDVVVIAGAKASRGAMLRRAVQSERHVLCVHPADEKPDAAFEASMIQADTGRVVLPLLPEAFHPGMGRFAQLAKSRGVEVFEVRRDGRDDFWLDLEGDDPRAGLPGWDVLRRIGGEIVEVYALAGEEEPTRGRPLVLAGKFADGRLFHATYQANQPENFWRIAAVGSRPLALVFPDGWPGAAALTYEDETGAMRTESWPATPPWTPLVDAFERAALARRHRPAPGAATADDRCWTAVGDGATAEAIQAAETMVGVTRSTAGPSLGWTDEIRALELDDSARRSLRTHRAVSLDLQNASEEASFKGTMTLVGCSLMWIVLVLLILSVWFPWLGWLIVPSLGVFLVLQILRGLVKGESGKDRTT